MADRVVETAPGTMIVSYHAVLSSVRFSWTPRLKKYEQALTLLSPYSVALLLAVYSFIFWIFTLYSRLPVALCVFVVGLACRAIHTHIKNNHAVLSDSDGTNLDNDSQERDSWLLCIIANMYYAGYYVHAVHGHMTQSQLFVMLGLVPVVAVITYLLFPLRLMAYFGGIYILSRPSWRHHGLTERLMPYLQHLYLVPPATPEHRPAGGSSDQDEPEDDSIEVDEEFQRAFLENLESEYSSDEEDEDDDDKATSMGTTHTPDEEIDQSTTRNDDDDDDDDDADYDGDDTSRSWEREFSRGLNFDDSRNDSRRPLTCDEVILQRAAVTIGMPTSAVVTKESRQVISLCPLERRPSTPDSACEPLGDSAFALNPLSSSDAHCTSVSCPSSTSAADLREMASMSPVDSSSYSLDPINGEDKTLRPATEPEEVISGEDKTLHPATEPEVISGEDRTSNPAEHTISPSQSHSTTPEGFEVISPEEVAAAPADTDSSAQDAQPSAVEHVSSVLATQGAYLKTWLSGDQ